MGDRKEQKNSRKENEEKTDKSEPVVNGSVMENHARYTKQKPKGVYTPEIDLTWVVLMGLAAALRLYNLSQPASVVFDEVHFGRFAAYFMRNIFFFDVHPPLGKLLYAAAGYLSGFDGGFEFQEIGQDVPFEYQQHVYNLRLLPAIFSTMLVPLVYEIISDFGCAYWTAVLGALLVCFENILVVQSKFVLLDSPLLFFIALSICCYMKLLKEHSRPFAVTWWVYLTLIGISFTCCVSIKYTGLYSVILVASIAGYELWLLVGDRSIHYIVLIQHAIARFMCLIVLPMVLYVAQYYVLFQILYKSGPTDQLMSSAFQRTLEGGLETITRNQAEVVAYGSQITLRSTHSKQCWLHSHQDLYPIKYPDGRGSSAQQQVTCYAFKDINNWWIVKHPESDSLNVDFPPRFVKNGDIINLVHGTTGRGLNSHDVAAPLNPQLMEVSGYIDHNVSMDSQLGWRLEIINPDESNLWKAIDSQIRLIHVNTSASMKVSGEVLPEWGFNQYEVGTDRMTNTQESIFNVEEHNQNITLPEGMTEEEAKKILVTQENSLPSYEMSFFEKFWEMQIRMLKTDTDLVTEHAFASRPLDWPLMRKGVAYWMANDSNRQIFCIGNPFIWYCGTFMIILYVILLGLYLLRRRRLVYDLTHDEWNTYVISGLILLGGYLINYLPYFPSERMLFIHHYLPALLFKIMIIPIVLDHLYSVIFCDFTLMQMMFKIICFVYMVGVMWCYQYFSVFTYGTTALSAKEIHRKRWWSSWNFLTHEGT